MTGAGWLVVFDCDGVLVDSERLKVELDVVAIGELGWSITRDEVIARHVGRSATDVEADIARMTGAAVPQSWVERWQRIRDTTYQTQLRPVPGVESALVRLAERGYAVCVASSATHTALQLRLGLTGLLEYFAADAIFSTTDVARAKPAPDLFLHAARSMGCEPRRCVVVEDSPFGIAAAHAAGMRVVGFCGGVTTAEQLADAEVLLDDMGGLPEVVEAILGARPS